MIAALFVHPGGVYYNLPNIEPWNEDDDARLYDGPWPIIAHPPCQRWGRYWAGGPSASYRRKLGDDNGCFKAALAAVRKFGGVIEHPEASKAWEHFGLLSPKKGGWVSAGDGGWTCCVEQGHYGHKARKATWLYVNGVHPMLLPEIKWGHSGKKMRMDAGCRSTEEYRRLSKQGILSRLSRLSRLERIATPTPFRNLLIEIVSEVRK